MNTQLSIRTRAARFFYKFPRAYDFIRQERLRLFGPATLVGEMLNAYSRSIGDNFVFLQIGANDGLRNDPLRDFIVRDNWRGVLVEPLPTVYPLLLKNYAYLVDSGAELQFSNCAVSRESSFLPFYTFKESYLSTKSSESRLFFERKASFFRRHLEEWVPSGDCIDEIMVPAVEVNELIGEYFNERSISLLALDVEGHEFEILKSVDFRLNRINAILFETWCLGVDKENLFNLLENNNYVINEAEGDALAILEPNSSLVSRH